MAAALPLASGGFGTFRSGMNARVPRLEGAAAGTVYGTYLHGSLLPKNPAFADQILAQALTRRFGSVNLAPLDDTIELNAHKRALTLPA